MGLPVESNSGLPAIPSFLAGLMGKEDLDLLKKGGSTLIIASVNRDGALVVKKGKDTLASVLNAEIQVVPIQVKTPRAMWLEEDSAGSPDCKSDDSIVGIGRQSLDQEEDREMQCKLCPANKFQSAHNGKGKLCRETVTVAVVLASWSIHPNDPNFYLVRKSARWWLEDIGKNGNAIPVHSEKQGWLFVKADDFVVPDPIVMRFTISSFDVWNKVISDTKSLGKGWPITLGTIWTVNTLTDKVGGFNVGKWAVKVIGMDESVFPIYEAASSIAQEYNDVDIQDAGYSADGVVKDSDDDGLKDDGVPDIDDLPY